MQCKRHVLALQGRSYRGGFFPLTALACLQFGLLSFCFLFCVLWLLALLPCTRPCDASQKRLLIYCFNTYRPIGQYILDSMREFKNILKIRLQNSTVLWYK